MAVCSLYEIPSFLNLFLRNPGCFPIVQDSQARGVCFAFADKLACLFSRVVQRAIQIFRPVDGQKDREFFRKDPSVHALMRYWTGSPVSIMRMSVVVPLTTAGAHDANQKTK